MNALQRERRGALMTKLDDPATLLGTEPIAEPEAENSIMKRADRFLIAGVCIAGTWVFGVFSIPFLLIGFKLLNQAQREGKLTRPWAVTILGLWCLIDASINFIFWGTDFFMAHDTDLLRTAWSGYGKLIDGAYYIDYNSLSLGGTANLSEKTLEFMGVLIIMPMRMAAAWGFFKMKRWGLQAMVTTSYMWMALWTTYMFQMFLAFNARNGAGLYGVTGTWLLFIPFATPFVVLPYLYTVNRERFTE
jgi:hypothetical protein